MLISKFTKHDIEDQIVCMEKKYSIIIPIQYKEFLYKYNGGYTPKTKFRVGRISSDIRGFYGVGDVKLSLNSINLREWLGMNLLPIACDSFGNHIVISLDDENKGKIFFCDHEKGNKTDYIAEDIKGFIRSCKSEKISDASVRTIKEREDALIANGRGEIINDDLRKIWQAEIDKYSDMVQEEVMIEGW